MAALEDKKKGALILLRVSPREGSLTRVGYAPRPTGVILEPEKHGLKEPQASLLRRR